MRRWVDDVGYGVVLAALLFVVVLLGLVLLYVAHALYGYQPPPLVLWLFARAGLGTP